MLALLSPAKSLDFNSPLATRRFTQPRLVDQAEQLIEVMRSKSLEDVAQLMRISDDLAAVNVGRYAAFTPDHDRDNARPAVLAFDGDVYQGMQARTFDERDFTECQKTVRILSGLYGLLRPLDLIQPYRLEMGTRLQTERGTSLYDWWGEQVTDLINQDQAASPGAEAVINLASNEYFSVVRTDLVQAPVITPRFEDRDQRGVPRVVSFYTKRARGAMAAWLVRGRVRSVAKLRDFNELGYRLEKARSTRSAPVFVR